MERLDVFPEEMLVKIIRNVPHNSLPALGRCSRKFQRLIVPQLYRCVYFNGNDQACHNSYCPDPLDEFCKWKRSLPISKPADKGSPSHEPSQIFKLGSFLRTIQSSGYLRSHVAVAAFGWFDPHGIAVPEGWDLQRVTTILSYLLPSLQSVYLSANVPPATIIPLELNLTSLALSYDRFDDQGSTIEGLHNLFCIKGLRHLTLDGIRSWHRWITPRGNFRDQGFVSNLTSLSLHRIRAPVDVILKDIIAWPKALEKVYISIIPDQRFSTAHVIYPLLDHQQSLTELHIRTTSNPSCSVRANDPYYEPAKSSHLYALKRLCIPLEHFIITKLRMILALGSDIPDFSAQILHDTIPPGLEQLMIECPEEMDDEPNPFIHHLSLWQKDIRKYQRYYPNLKDVIVVLRDTQEAWRRRVLSLLSISLREVNQISEIDVAIGLRRCGSGG